MKGKLPKSMTIIIQKIEAKSITRKEKKGKKKKTKQDWLVCLIPTCE